MTVLSAMRAKLLFFNPRWRALVRVIPIRNLNPGESRVLLEKRCRPKGEHKEEK